MSDTEATPEVTAEETAAAEARKAAEKQERSERAKRAWDTRRANKAAKTEPQDKAIVGHVDHGETPPAPGLPSTSSVPETQISASQTPTGTPLPPIPPRPDLGDAPPESPQALVSPADSKPAEHDHMGDFGEAREPESLIPDEQGDDVILIHVLQDGFTPGGLAKVFYKGETISIDRNGETYKKTLDRNGNSWLDMSVDEQKRRYDGRQMFGFGPSPFVKVMTQDEWDKAILEAETPEEEIRLKKKRQREHEAPVPVSSGG